MMLLEEYSTAMDRALTMAYRGQASIGDSARIMAMVGIKGSGTVQHHNLQMETHTLVSNTVFEVGMKTTVRRTVQCRQKAGCTWSLSTCYLEHHSA
jgi:hypothetical protein